jgi:MFS family permease
MPKGFHLLVVAQVASALADNALLIVAIALLEVQGLPGWWAPLLKFFFVISYVVLAPFVGPLADALPKAKLMAWMNATKALGVIAMFAGVHPALSFGVVGFAAAAYAPAKYGLVTEMVGADRLVAANGWIEVAVVAAVLLGAMFGGFLVSDLASGVDNAVRAALATAGLTAQPYAFSLLILLVVYAVAGVLNTGIPDSGARYPRSALDPREIVRVFYCANRTLWRDRLGGLSLAVTTAWWGVAATLQFAVLRWSVDVLGLKLAQAAYLQAVVAIGVVVGAGMAGHRIRIETVHRVLPVGIAMGLVVLSVALIDSVLVAIPVLLVVGVLGGFLLVPMNALLQHRGYRLLSAGHSIAVQGFNENLSVLVMLAVYTAVLAAGAPIVPVMMGFGLSVSAALAVLMMRFRRG